MTRIKIRTKTHTRTITTATFDDVEVELQHHAPYDAEVLAERIGDGLVIAYLVRDPYPSNPLTDFDGQGDLYTRGQGVITDNERELHRALGLDGYGGIDIDATFKIEGQSTSLRAEGARLMMLRVEADADLQFEVMAYDNQPDGTDFTEWLQRDGGHCDTKRDALISDMEEDSGQFSEERYIIAKDLYAKHWREIAGPEVVPMSYFHERGETAVHPTTWDGDCDDVPNAVWVAGPEEMENVVAYPEGVSVGQIKGDDGKYTAEYELVDNGKQVHRGSLGECWGWMKANYTITDKDLIRAVEKYAKSVCSEYARWCSGEVFGCVVETFELTNAGSEDAPEFEQVIEDSCWGLIGLDYAIETLRSEFFDPAVATAKTVSTGV